MKKQQIKKYVKKQLGKLTTGSSIYGVPVYTTNMPDYDKKYFEFRTKLNNKMWDMFWEYDIELDDLVDALERWTKDIKEEVKKQAKLNK
jgi:hypothetical protein